MKPYGSTETWILVCDGAHAKLFINHGGNDGVHREAETAQDIPPAHEIRTNRRGRNRSHPSNALHAFTSTDGVREQKKETFLKEVAEKINQAAGQINRLVVAAPPKALAVLRDALSPQVKTKIVAEIDKDLTHSDERTLPQHLKEYINLRDRIHEFNYQQAKLFTTT